jgi:hypothetical protein
MSEFIEKYPSKKSTILNLIGLLMLPAILHYYFPELFIISFFFIPFIITNNWLEGFNISLRENKKEYIIINATIKLIPLISSLVAIKLVN